MQVSYILAPCSGEWCFGLLLVFVFVFALVLS